MLAADADYRVWLAKANIAMLPLLPVIDASARADTNAYPGD